MMVRHGVDPVEAELERRRQAVDLAFDSYAASFVERYLKERWKQWQAGNAVLANHAIPVLRNKALPKIGRGDLNPIWDGLRDRPAVARLTFATLRKLFRWAVSRGDLERSPLEGVEAPPAIPPRDRVLSDRELAVICEASTGIGEPFASFYQILLLTGQRREEVASMQWDELEQDTATWMLPGSRTKNAQPHLVPLSQQVLHNLDHLAGGLNWPRSGLVFSTNGKTAISGFSKAKRRLDEAVKALAGGGESHAQPWRVHDLRRTVATGLQRLGVRFEVTEAVLNHVSGSRSGVAGVYQRHDWKAEKRAALDAWGAHVESLGTIASDVNIVRFTPRNA
jgi:integrase